LQRRQAELERIDAAASPADVSTNVDVVRGPGEFDSDIQWDVGGATTMTGASYFWFFTWLMLGTAIVFVPVGYFYRAQTYLQEEVK
jgi:hypothetical protein